MHVELKHLLPNSLGATADHWSSEFLSVLTSGEYFIPEAS